MVVSSNKSVLYSSESLIFCALSIAYRVKSHFAVLLPSPSPLSLKSGQLQSFRRGILQDEPRLKERGVAECALYVQLINQFFKRNVLMLVRVQNNFANMLEQRSETWIAGEVCAQHQRVDEESDKFFSFDTASAGDGCADDDVVLSGMTEQESFEGCQ